MAQADGAVPTYNNERAPHSSAGKSATEGEVIHVVAQELIRPGQLILTGFAEDEFELTYANADHVKSFAKDGFPSKKPGPLRGVNEGTKPQTENADGSLVSSAKEVQAKNEKPFLSRKPAAVNQGRHPRNVRIIPKSRDFH